MDISKEYTGTVSAAKDFFGLKPDQTIGGFSMEWKQLTERDKLEIKEGLQKIGYKIVA